MSCLEERTGQFPCLIYTWFVMTAALRGHKMNSIHWTGWIMVTEHFFPVRSFLVLRTSFCCRSSSLIRISLASARAALFAANLASACETQHEHTCWLRTVTHKVASLFWTHLLRERNKHHEGQSFQSNTNLTGQITRVYFKYWGHLFPVGEKKRKKGWKMYMRVDLFSPLMFRCSCKSHFQQMESLCNVFNSSPIYF